MFLSEIEININFFNFNFYNFACLIIVRTKKTYLDLICW